MRRPRSGVRTSTSCRRARPRMGISRFGGFGPCRVARAEALTSGGIAAMIGWVCSTDPYGLRKVCCRWVFGRSPIVDVARAGMRLQGGRKSEEFRHRVSRRMPRIALESRGERSGERGIEAIQDSHARGNRSPSRDPPVLDEEPAGTRRKTPVDQRKHRHPSIESPGLQGRQDPSPCGGLAFRV